MTGSLQQLLSRMLRSPRRAMLAYALLFLPGVALHEASHWLAARLLGVRATSFSLLPKVTRGGILRLGYVQIEAVDPFRSTLIGAAPLLAGSLALTVIGRSILALDEAGLALAAGRLEDLPRALAGTTGVHAWGVWVYLAVVISNTMLPSRSDRAAWGWILVGVGMIASLLLAVGWADEAARLAAAPIEGLLAFLAGAFTLTAALNLALGLPLWALVVVTRRG